MNARRWLVLAALAVGGCSGGSNSGTGSDAGIVARGDGGACDATHDCLPTKCICGDGTTPETSAECVAGSCVDESSECVDRCGTSGVVDAGPIETVAGSPECDAFCAKAVQQCGSGVTCNESFFCEVTDGQCEASMKAFLQCEADTGTWTCQSSGWAQTSSCSYQVNLCNP